MNKVRVRLVRGLAGTKQGHRDTVRGLGLKKINQVVELADSPEVRGMINRVNYLVRIES
ncbi:MAG TPA: 50S ribosomal protein L30 [Burkholderiales bacterium]|jgi:large subunit ribosomal protein L30|nr:50S ribosomal protein L30 [Burkholderiales bacterium]